MKSQKRKKLSRVYHPSNLPVLISLLLILAGLFWFLIANGDRSEAMTFEPASKPAIAISSEKSSDYCCVFCREIVEVPESVEFSEFIANLVRRPNGRIDPVIVADVKITGWDGRYLTVSPVDGQITVSSAGIIAVIAVSDDITFVSPLRQWQRPSVRTARARLRNIGEISHCAATNFFNFVPELTYEDSNYPLTIDDLIAGNVRVMMSLAVTSDRYGNYRLELTRVQDGAMITTDHRDGFDAGGMSRRQMEQFLRGNEIPPENVDFINAAGDEAAGMRLVPTSIPPEGEWFSVYVFDTLAESPRARVIVWR